MTCTPPPRHHPCAASPCCVWAWLPPRRVVKVTDVAVSGFSSLSHSLLAGHDEESCHITRGLGGGHVARAPGRPLGAEHDSSQPPARRQGPHFCSHGRKIVAASGGGGHRPGQQPQPAPGDLGAGTPPSCAPPVTPRTETLNGWCLKPPLCDDSLHGMENKPTDQGPACIRGTRRCTPPGPGDWSI